MFGNGHIESEVDKNFYRIGEVSRLTDTKTFVLRYWETEFPMLQPVKSPKGHRLYRREDVETVLRIKRLLYDEGFTIAGARRHLREERESGDSPNAQSYAQPYAGAEAVYDPSLEVHAAEAESSGDATHVRPPAGEEVEGHSGTPELESWLLSEDRQPAQERMTAERRAEPPPTIGRKVLLDLRDSLQAFLTLLENE